MKPTAVPGRNAVFVWLMVVALMIFGMVILGGLTRLTESGLSIVEWRPLLGAIPPLNEAEWQAVFQQYQQFPEYKLHNTHMNLEQFKFIFYMEYSHRLLGRLIGLVFFLPFVFFAIKGWLKGMVPQLTALFALGGLQGFVGWYMVKSGLVDMPHVSQYRLVLHLTLAVTTLTLALWFALGLRPGPAAEDRPLLARQFKPLLGLAGLLVIQMGLGGFVAGLDAGYQFNTWPSMNGAMVPEGLLGLEPLWRNLFENRILVQFLHRNFAWVVAIALVCGCYHYRNITANKSIQLAWTAVPLLVALQILLGILTLIWVMPVGIASAHQGVALLLWSTVIYLLRQSHLSR